MCAMEISVVFELCRQVELNLIGKIQCFSVKVEYLTRVVQKELG